MRIARQPTRETRQASKIPRAAIVNAAQPSRRTPQPRWRVKMTGSRVIPCLRYRDAKRMIGWLCDAYGFRAQAVYEDGSDGIAHAQLTLGDGMIMLSSLRDDRFSQVQSTPAALGGTRRVRTWSSPTPMRSITAPLLLGPRSSSRSKTRTMAGGAFAVATPRATFGTLALMIPGKSDVRPPRIRRAST